MSDGMRRELVYLSSYATNRYFIPNWGICIPTTYCKYVPQCHNDIKYHFIQLTTYY